MKQRGNNPFYTKGYYHGTVGRYEPPRGAQELHGHGKNTKLVEEHEAIEKYDKGWEAGDKRRQKEYKEI